MTRTTDLIVGEKEIAARLRVAPNTVHQWARRGLLPAREGEAGGSPAWHWSTIEGWARETGRMPGLREAILDSLLDVPTAQTTPLAESLIDRGVARSVPQARRAINDLHHEGLVAPGLGNDWYLSDLGRMLARRQREGDRDRGRGAAPRVPRLADLKARRDEILAIAARHHATNVRVVGSVARDESQAHSDVDLMVDMDVDKDLSGLHYFSELERCREELAQALGCKVDVLDAHAMEQNRHTSRLRENFYARVTRDAIAL